MIMTAIEARLTALESEVCDTAGCAIQHGRDVRRCFACNGRIEAGDAITGVPDHDRMRIHDVAFTKRYQHVDCDNPTNAKTGVRSEPAASPASLPVPTDDPRFDAMATQLAALTAQVAKLTGQPTVKTESEATANAIKHECMDGLLARLVALNPDMRNVWLTGSPGSGKTFAARQAASLLGVPFGFTGAIDTEYKLSGFIDAQGRYLSTEFRRIWQHGGVFLFDEIDVSLPPAVLAFNAALANGHAVFPDGEVARHPDCYIIAAANTWGYGNTSEYVGRNRQDATTLDRFVKYNWRIDEGLERKLADCDEWVNIVHAIRRAAKSHGAKIAVTPRISINGGRLLKAGLPKSEVIESTFGGHIIHEPFWSEVGRAAIEWAAR